MSNKNRIFVSIFVSLLAIAILVLLVLTPPMEAFLIPGIITAIIMGLLLGALLYLWLRKHSQDEIDAKQKQKQLKRKAKLVSGHFDRMLKQQAGKRRFHSRYDQPIYLFLTADTQEDKALIQQMGYEAYKLDEFGSEMEFPILFWISEHSILISIQDNLEPELLKTLNRKLNKWRGRQAANGILLATNIEKLLKGNKDQQEQLAEQNRLNIITFNQAFGLNLPVYCVFTQMSALADFCQYFSAFEESRLDEALGATMPVSKNCGINPDWFEQSFDKLIQQLISGISGAISAQLSPEYRQAISSAPYQFGLIKQELWRFLQHLCRTEQLHQGISFRGYYFTNTQLESQTTDLLASSIGADLGYTEIKQGPASQIRSSMFTQHLISHVILHENHLVGVNKPRENRLLLTQSAYAACCCLLLAGVVSMIKFNFDDQSRIERRADILLERYKEAIAATPYNLENMAENIPNLYSMYEIYQLYQQPKPWYAVIWIPSPSIKQEVANAYFDQLKHVLLPSMVNTLEKDLFVYVTLEDQSKTLELLNLYNLLYQNERTDNKRLIEYFNAALLEQGDVDSANLKQLTKLQQGLFQQNLTPQKQNYALQELAKNVINQSGLEHLLYKHISENTKFSRRVDIRSELGNRFFELFNFSQDYVGYMVPYMFTPQGFNEIDLTVTSPLIQDALRTYEGVAGKSPSALEVYRISKDLRQTYINDYISYWRNFASQINLQVFSGSAELKQTLTRLTEITDTPLIQLYQTLKKYTHIEIDAARLPPATEQATQLLTEQLNVPQIKSDKNVAANQINLVFAHYQKYIAWNEQGSSPLGLLQGQLGDVKDWLDNFYHSADPGQAAFTRLSQPLQGNNPVAQLQQAASKQPDLVNELVQKLSLESNKLVLQLAHQHINKVWQTNVLLDYNKLIAPFYPFNESAIQDSNLAEVKRFFAHEGTLTGFINEYLKAFSELTYGQPSLPGLLPDTALTLDPRLWQMIVKAKTIQDGLFMQGPQTFGLNFKLKANNMSSSITEFSIYTDKPVFQYRHGPSLWVEVSWPNKAQVEDFLGLELKAGDQKLSDQKLAGSWNWFRLLTPNMLPHNSNQVELAFEQQNVVLELKTDSQVNPFEAGFFSHFLLPESI